MTHYPVELLQGGKVQGEGVVKHLLLLHPAGAQSCSSGRQHTVPFQQREEVTAGYTAPLRPDKLGYDMKFAVYALHDDGARQPASLRRDEGCHVGHVGGWLADPAGGSGRTVRWWSCISDTVSILQQAVFGHITVTTASQRPAGPSHLPFYFWPQFHFFPF